MRPWIFVILLLTGCAADSRWPPTTEAPTASAVRTGQEPALGAETTATVGSALFTEYDLVVSVRRGARLLAAYQGTRAGGSMAVPAGAWLGGTCQRL